ncbi:hypothetical protein HMPREF9517_00148 [Enterococcus faecalis TX1341]|uniref:Uncharacterized protein n=1 Tax=Enterococcus faecalis TX4248 TaxID=749495 RepID=A0A125W8B8_ENTFL|nr:hypothetical protein HMPREF9515_00478 [Enterococcus faecalis TX0860]EFM83782.1 hypothetical protein HMPREF9498_00576 [Enterococcus faecalis TX4248]EFQ08783.1 hypothetical protein HMPREF9492_02842 [Enterococcus faecalis DAPTO 512]EFQ13540.1 hypothetical protein HMPREF9504_00879 [Enterococcus faecalis TX0102]EFT42574.1 hypothetical protein HMPREF9496_00410 [Enterococcus faecalis TX4000]EFT48500.1 hypothetical protein HMPREF9501_00663 [Enterococcus faecalis TX0027]EFU04050.1 hypothetical prot
MNKKICFLLSRVRGRYKKGCYFFVQSEQRIVCYLVGVTNDCCYKKRLQFV